MEGSWAWEKDLNSFQASARSAWLETTGIGAPTNGHLFVGEDDIVITSQTSQSLYTSDDGCKVTSDCTLRARRHGQEVSTPEVFVSGMDVAKSCLLSSYSPDNQYLAQISTTKKSKPGDGDDDCYHLVVTDRRTQSATYINLSAQKSHGAICPAGQFGALAWSADCTKLVYVADAKTANTKSYFPSSLDVDTDAGSEEVSVGDENLYRNNWGEQLTKFHHTVLVVVHWRAGEQSVKVVDTPLDDISLGQPIWGPVSDSLGESLVFVGWKEESPRVGLIYCTQRPSNVYIHYLKESMTESIGRPNKSVHSPNLSPSGDKLVFLEQDARGPHHACGRLMVYDCINQKLSVSVDVVGSAPGSEFPGIFSWSGLASRCWSKNGRFVFFETQWRSEQVIVGVDVTTGDVVRLAPALEVGGWAFLDIDDDVVLARYSNPCTPPTLRILFVNAKSAAALQRCDHWIPMTTRRSLPIEYRIVDLVPDDYKQGGASSKIPFQAIFYCPVKREEEGGKRKAHPLIVMPHGGPHSCVPASYSAFIAASCLLGFYTVVVNYRGSSGFGQDSILSLLGKVGTNDTNDVQVAARCAVDELPIDTANVFIHGGSHGGFLCAHAIGQFPSFYRATCMRNPVIDFTSLLGVSDIPDWALVEAGWVDEPATTPTPELVQQLLDCSPIKHVDKVTAATLMLIGEQDARVPPSQGHRYISLLKHRSVKCRLQSYPKDCHPLNKVKTEADVFMNMFMWFKQSMEE